MKKNLLFAFIAFNVFIGATAQQFGSRTLITPNATNVNSFTFHDIDEDGDIDIIATSSNGSVSSSLNHVFWYKNQGNNTFSAKILISSAYDDIAEVKLLDVDEDGKKDLVVGDNETGMSWIKNMGSGFFGTKQNLPYNTYMSTFEVGDMNNDGKEDIIVAQLSGDSLHFLRNTGNGVFVYESMFYTVTHNIYSLTFGDLDQDQVTDLIVSTGGTTTQKIIQFEYVGNAFVQTNIYTSPSAPNVYGSFLADMDNDGKVDVVTEGSTCGGYWFKNFGNNVYSGITPVSLTGCNNFNFAGPVDLDMDGFKDYVYYRYGTINYRKATGVAEIDPTVMPISQASTIVGELEETKFFDIDSDGDLDVFYITASEFGWYANNAAQLSTTQNVAAKVTLSPNPVNSELNIVSAVGIDSYRIYDNTGKLVASESFSSAISNYSINLSQLSNGLYFVDLQSGASREIKKVIKN